MTKLCDACEFLKKPSYPIVRTKHWNVELATNHAYLGRAYVTLLEHKSSLSELSPEEWHDFEALVQKLEAAYHKAFGAGPFNWSCLMNNAYQEKPYNPHVHWHLVPRYEKPVDIDGQTFTDDEFGHMFAPFKERTKDDQTVKKIAEAIKAQL
jgi:diadenosine tetraphosphate (Ap4A) HIT family hydrolase